LYQECLILKKLYVGIALACLISLTACSGKDKNDVQQKPAKNEATETFPNEDSFIFPLTGLPSKVESVNRPVAVMINNHPKARPQSGLAKADIVYEVLAEGELTRFLAIFQSEKPEKIGPVRSARDYFIDLAQGYHSFYVAHGYSPEAKQMLTTGYIDNLNGMQFDGKFFHRDATRVAPHNSYTSFSDIEKGAEKLAVDLTGAPEPLSFLTKNEADSIVGEQATDVTVTYYHSLSFTESYKYVASIKKYIRSSGGEPTVDRETKQPVKIDNLFIVEMNHKVLDDHGRRAIDLESGGDAYILQRGKMRKVKWKNDLGRIVPVDESGQIGFVPGKTWIQVIPTNPGLSSMVTVK
jgi:hypothetical protein